MPENIAQAGGRLEEALAERIRSGATGELEVTDGKKRWLFFFEGGKLTFTRSNLKSESAEALQAAQPQASKAQLLHAQAVMRVRNALKAPGVTWNFQPDAAAPPKTAPLSAGAVLVEALSSAHDEPALRALAAPLAGAWPKAADGVLADLGGDEALEAYLSDLDGSRSGEEVVQFAPGGPARALAALWLGEKLGWFTAGAPPKAGPAGGMDLDLGFDLDAVIADAGSAIPDLPPADPILPPSSADASSGPREHPMAEKLRTLADRARMAETHFDLFGLPWDAPVDQFRGAYRDLARELHPDRYADASPDLQELATEIFDKVRAAWEVLENEASRQKYIDKTIHGKKTEEELAMEQLQNYWSAEADFKKGVAAFNQGKLTNAHEFFTRAVDAVPDELEFKAYFAFTSFSLNRVSDHEKAMEYLGILKDVIEKNQGQERKLDGAWVLLGRAYREDNESEKAKRCFVQALRINPSNADAVREMKRLTSGAPSAPAPEKKDEKKAGGGFFSRLFGKK